MQLSMPIDQPQNAPALPLDEIAARATAAGTNLKRLARAAGLAPSTAYRGARKPTECRRSTEQKLSAALLAHERHELARLLALHGRPKEAGEGDHDR